MRILLIDDEPGVTENLGLYLRNDFHAVKILNYIDSKEQLEEFLDSFRPEGVVLDFDMDPSGPEVYAWIRHWNEGVPIVFYTQYAKNPSHRDKMMEVGARTEHIIAKRETARDASRLIRSLRTSAFAETC